jgi:hypothetical protein
MPFVAAVGLMAGAAAGTAAFVVGGAIIGAVIGGVIAAVNGDNILEGALKGGAIGAMAGWGIGASGLAGAGGVTGTQGGMITAEGAAAGFGEGGAATIAASETGATAGLGSGALKVAALEGVGEAYSAEMESDAAKEAAAMRLSELDKERAARRATWTEAPQVSVQDIQKKGAVTAAKSTTEVAAPMAAEVKAETGEIQTDFLPPKPVSA